jgi:RNA polymerase sigma factor (sigma-70 family)
MSEFSSFAEVLAGLSANSQTAAEAVVRRNYTRLVAVVRSRISPKYQAKVDAESVANSAMKSFFRDYSGDRLAVSDWQDLWNIIARIAFHKLSNRIRTHRQKKRTAESGEADVSYEGQDGVEFADSPELEVIASDLYSRLLESASPEERAVLDLSLQGYLVREVAVAIGTSERTVIRIRKELQRKMEKMMPADE